MKYLFYSLQVLLAGIFLFSFISKTIDASEFRDFVIKIGIPKEFVYYSLIGTLVVELGLAIHLLLGLHLTSTLRISLMTYMIFTGILTYAFIMGLNASCGCFGGFMKSDVSIATLIRNVILIILTGLLYYKRKYCYAIFK